MLFCYPESPPQDILTATTRQPITMIQKYLFIISFLVAAVLLSTCKKDYDLPTGSNKVELAAITTDSVSYFSVKIQSRLNNTGGNTISDYGLCWSLDPNPDITKYHKSNGYIAAPIDISASFQNLLPGKKYYIRSYATIPTGTVYGLQSEFTTLKTGLPVSLTDTITDITYTSAVCKGLVVADSGLMVTRRGICWSLTPNPLVADNADTIGKGLGAYEIKIDALNPGLTYYIRAFAVNDSGTSYGSQKTLITNSLSVPLLTTSIVNNITHNSATSGGNITSAGGAEVTARGLCWNTSQNPTIFNTHTSDNSGIGTFLSTIIDLSPGTTYYVRSYATNSVGTSYGNELSFKTLTLPTVTTTEVTNIAQTTAVGGGNVIDNGGAIVTVRGLCWSTSPTPTINDNRGYNGTGNGSFISIFSSLNANTIYYVRAYATNSVGTSYGAQVTFTTLPPVIPSVVTTSVSNITLTTAVIFSNISSDGGSTVIAKGVCWSISQNPTIADLHTSLGGGGIGNFTSNITDLSSGITYYVRSYATNSIGTAYGNELSFTTLSLPIVTTSEVTNITQTTAMGGGNILYNGGTTVIARGVCWSFSSNPTISDSHTSDGNGNGSFISNLSNLISDTVYYVRSYATNSVGTSYGNQVIFITLPPVLPSITTVDVTSITQSTAISGGNITFDGGSPIIVRGVCWSTSHNPTIVDNHSNDNTGTGLFASTLTGLYADTLYYIRAYATNSVGTAYGNELNFSTPAYTIGQNYGGGIIFYIDGSEQHGLISATNNQSSGGEWGCSGTSLATATFVGSGQSNTVTIVGGCNQAGIAAIICNDLVLNGYNDWFLPSIDELNLMYLGKSVIGGFSDYTYWSSSQYGLYSTVAWVHEFRPNGVAGYDSKNTNINRVRAIRAF